MAPGYDAPMTISTWIAALFALSAVLGTGAVLTVSALRAWRSFRRFSRAAGEALDDVLRAAGEAERHTATTAAGTERLATATARLKESRTHLSLLQGAAGEFGATLARLRGAVPTK